MNVIRWQRLEAVFVAMAIIAVFVVAGHDWWWLAVLFLAYDLSALGYLAGPIVGAFAYNAVHNYAGPSLALLAALLVAATGADAGVLAIVAASWGVHVAVDRALGYGLKTDAGFEHTHLGAIGRARRARSPRTPSR